MIEEKLEQILVDAVDAESKEDALNMLGGLFETLGEVMGDEPGELSVATIGLRMLKVTQNAEAFLKNPEQVNLIKAGEKAEKELQTLNKDVAKAVLESKELHEFFESSETKNCLSELRESLEKRFQDEMIKQIYRKVVLEAGE